MNIALEAESMRITHKSIDFDHGRQQSAGAAAVKRTAIGEIEKA